MLISNILKTCLQLKEHIINKIINKNKVNKRRENRDFRSYKQCEQTYNNNNVFFLYKGVIT